MSNLASGLNTVENIAPHLDPVSLVIFWVTILLFFGVVGSTLAKRLKQSSVLGELLMGVLLGNLGYFFAMPLAIILREGTAPFEVMRQMLHNVPLLQAVHAVFPNPNEANAMLAVLSDNQGADWLKIASVIDGFSRYGVIFLLFMVGLDSSLTELKRTGRESLQVAFIGVAAPIVLGLLVTSVLMPELSFKADLFVAATLSATSIGVTARVLRDLKILNTREAKTILGAAMFDDVLGLVILAVVCSIVTLGTIDILAITRTLIFVSLFFFVAIFFGPWLLRRIIRLFGQLEPEQTKLYSAFIFVMVLAWFATQVQLAAIMGAFVAGMILNDTFFEESVPDETLCLSIKQILMPLESVFSPLFFVLIGIQVKLETFANQTVLIAASGLLGAAILGKLVSGWGANASDDRALIGIGMLPRGEVGLVFAATGRTMGVISDELFSAIIVMIIVTTLIAPPWLKSCSKRILSKSAGN